MGELNRQQICAALNISESTVRRLEQLGLPYTPVGARSKRYDLEECKAWLKANPPGQQPRDMSAVRRTNELHRLGEAFMRDCKKIKLRVTPSEK